MPQRAYRHDLRCPHCGSNGMPKYGTSRGKQTYRCGDCKHRYTPDGKPLLFGGGQGPSGEYVYGEQQPLGDWAGVAGAAGNGLFLDQKKPLRPGPP